MNFQNLKTVENADFYLDVAFSNAKKKTAILRETKVSRDKLIKSKKLEQERIKVVKETLTKSLSKILKSFPELDTLPEFYNRLIKCTVDYDELKKSLGALNWAIRKTNSFHRIYDSKLKRLNEIKLVNVVRREFYGRTSSIIKQINNELLFLESARKIMKNYPHIKTSTFTVCIYGFPNVGKTTLLYKLTGSKPEIKDYSFTTKSINIGYTKYNINGKDEKIQFLDTPGTLNRTKMNLIEMQAELAVTLVSQIALYVFDLTESYPLKDQIALYENLKKTEKDIIIFVTKSDITDKKIITKFKKDYKFDFITDVTELNNIIQPFVKKFLKAQEEERLVKEAAKQENINKDSQLSSDNFEG